MMASVNPSLADQGTQDTTGITKCPCCVPSPDTGMPTLGCRGWAGCSAARAPAAWGGCGASMAQGATLGHRRQGSSSGNLPPAYTGMPRLGCPAARAPTAWGGCGASMAQGVRAGLLCGLVSTMAGGSKPLVVAKSIVYACVCPSRPSKRASAKRDWLSSCAFLFSRARIAHS